MCQYDVDVGTVMGFIFAFAIIIILIAMLFQLLLAWLVYKDANDNHDPNATLWAMIVFLSGIMGIIIYLLVKSRSPKKQYDPNAEIPLRKTSAIRYCPNCGTNVDNTSKFCMGCGVKV